MSESVSESENPAIDAPTPKTGGRPHGIRDWWPDQLDLTVLRVQEDGARRDIQRASVRHQPSPS